LFIFGCPLLNFFRYPFGKIYREFIFLRSVKEAPTMRHVMSLKTRSTEFFSNNTRIRTRTVDKSSSHVPSHASSNKETLHLHSTTGSTKQTNGVTNGSTTME